MVGWLSPFTHISLAVYRSCGGVHTLEQDGVAQDNAEPSACQNHSYNMHMELADHRGFVVVGIHMAEIGRSLMAGSTCTAGAVAETMLGDRSIVGTLASDLAL